MKLTKIKLTGIGGIFFFALCFCISCKETVHEELLILIRNRTDSPIHITLYPKAEYRSGNYYRQSDIGGGYQYSKRYLSPHDDHNGYDWEGALFTSSDLNIEPQTLASRVFDSIYISSTSNGNIVIKFTHEDVMGYTENIFSENSTWEFNINEYDAQTMFSRNPAKCYCYIFSILQDEIITE